MTLTSKNTHIQTFGASCRGPLHLKEGRPNEDAWLRSEGSFGSLVVVCDGVGSRPHARLGAQAACLSVRGAVARWSKAEGAPVSLLLHLIEVYWRLHIHPIGASDALTTCLWALALKTGEWILAGLGDGLLMHRTNQSPVEVLIGDRENGFGNETAGLGTSGSMKAWKVVQLPPTEYERVAVLATDGIADDLHFDKYDAFCSWLCDDIKSMSAQLRWRKLMNQLQDWPTPKHLDDKTLAVIFSSATRKGIS